MTLFGNNTKDWERDLSTIRGHRSRYYSQFNGEQEILLDCVAHEREDSKSIQCVVDYLMQRWRNPLADHEARAVARAYIEDTKNHGAHWSTWISQTLLTYSNKKLTPRPPPLPTAWQTDNILFDHMQQNYTLQPQSRLLSLPTELRLQILEHAVQPSTTTTPFATPKSTRGIVVGTKSSSHPPLSKACRQLRHEGLPIFYSTNTFIFPITTFPSLHASRIWLQNHLTDKYVPLLQNVLFLGFDRVPLNHNIPFPIPHGIAMALRQHDVLRPIRIAMNLRSLTMEIETEVPKGGEWLVKWEGYMEELRETLGGMEIGEWYLRTMVTEFARGVEDLERRGWNVCGGFPR